MIRWLVLFLVFAGPATAQETSLRPVARPEQQVAEPEADENTASDSAVATSLRPQPRTAAVAQAAETARVARVRGKSAATLTCKAMCLARWQDVVLVASRMRCASSQLRASGFQPIRR